MRRKRVWRYYCDFCGRGGCAASHIKRHEAGCTANPNRVCGLCARIKIEQSPIAELISALKSGPDDDYKLGLLALRKLAENCPACILAAIRQSGVQRPPSWDGEEDMDPGCSVEFHFKDELAAWWKETNSAEADHGDYY